jgi:hypothetical protein
VVLRRGHADALEFPHPDADFRDAASVCGHSWRHWSGPARAGVGRRSANRTSPRADRGRRRPRIADLPRTSPAIPSPMMRSFRAGRRRTAFRRSTGRPSFP